MVNIQSISNLPIFAPFMIYLFVKTIYYKTFCFELDFMNFELI